MASQFYNRYVPPKKVTKFDDKSIDNSAAKTERSYTKPFTTESTTNKKSAKLSAPKAEADEGTFRRPFSQHQPPGKPAENTEFESRSIPQFEQHGLVPFPQPLSVEEGPKVPLLSVLPQWIRAPTVATSFPERPFEEFLGDRIVSNLSKEGFLKANGLQSTILKMLVPSDHASERYFGDICISAATGSGKTLAYVLPMIESLREKPITRLRGLVVVPTRELVTQARETLEMAAAGTNIKIGTAVGNRNFKDEQESLIQIGQRRDLVAYKAEMENKIDEDEEVMDWDSNAMLIAHRDLECWDDHVLEYTSKVDILVCTPGRLVDHVKGTKGFNLHHVQWLVIDEADRLLDESFQQWVDNVMPQLDYLPPLNVTEQQISRTFHIFRRREIRKIVLSATMTRDVGKLVSLRLRRPRLVVLEGSREASETGNSQIEYSKEGESIELPATLHEFAMGVTNVEDKPLYLLHLLRDLSITGSNEVGKRAAIRYGLDRDAKVERDTNSVNDESSEDQSSSSDSAVRSATRSKAEINGTLGTLVFANSNEGALRLARLLAILLPNQKIRALTKSPGDKYGRKTLTMFRNGELAVIVATDLASRGLDIPNLALVINYDLPTCLNSYVHRVGRTARAGREGRAITLLEHKQAKWFWNDIARTSRIVRPRKVARMDGGLQPGTEEHQKYEEALEALGKEALGAETQKTRRRQKNTLPH